MEITAAGNVTINYPQPEAKPSGSQSAPVAATAKAGAGWLRKLVMSAALLGGGSGIGYIIHDVLKPAQSSVDTDTITEMDFPSN